MEGPRTPARPWGQRGAQGPPACLSHLPNTQHCGERGWSQASTRCGSGASLSPPQTRPGRLEPSRGQRYEQTREELREAGQGEARRDRGQPPRGGHFRRTSCPPPQHTLLALELPGPRSALGCWGLRVGTRARECPAPAPCTPQVEGRWLTVQLAASRAHLVSPDDPLRLGLHSIWTRGEDVEFVLFWTGEGVCQGVNITVHPTGLQGRYQGSLVGGTSMHVCFVSADYSSLILYIRLEDAGEVTSLWALLARRTRGDPKWRQKFLEYADRFHLQKAPVFNLDARCPAAEA
uniref:Lipocalin/cytosolic fatty-acid binding domain-containing protein n=1 Tax=Mustela putorius furo TaxID=9669 RepID=M3YKP6_MUSPF